MLYLVVNEGYLAHDEAKASIRSDLVDEAIRLTRLVGDLAPDEAEPLGLLALELFHQSRHASRVDALGDLVLLDNQDRTTWDRPLIAEANQVLGRAMHRMQPGPHQAQAAIAAHHADAPTGADTDWVMIASLYGQLDAMSDSPVVRLNRPVATAMADGPLAGLDLLDQVTDLDDYHLLWATRGELCRRADRRVDARRAFERALDLVPTRPSSAKTASSPPRSSGRPGRAEPSMDIPSTLSVRGQALPLHRDPGHRRARSRLLLRPTSIIEH